MEKLRNKGLIQQVNSSHESNPSSWTSRPSFCLSSSLWLGTQALDRMLSNGLGRLSGKGSYSWRAGISLVLMTLALWSRDHYTLNPINNGGVTIPLDECPRHVGVLNIGSSLKIVSTAGQGRITILKLDGIIYSASFPVQDFSRYS